MLTLGQGSVVVVEELLAVEGHQTLEDTVADTTAADGADDLALEVERVAGDVGDDPVAALDHLVGRDEVADEEEDAHHDMLGDRGHVGAGDLKDLDLALDGGVEVDVVRADTSGDTDLEVLCLIG